MILDIKPYVRLGEFKIGADKREISQLLDGDCQDMPEESSDHIQDVYPHVGLTFDYNEEGRCISIKATAPAIAMFEGMNLLETTFATIKERYPNYTRMENDIVLLTDVGIGLSLGTNENFDRQVPGAVTIFTHEIIDDVTKDLERWYRISC